MIAQLVRQNGECWLTFLKFLQVKERPCSPYFSNGDLVVLESQLHEFIKCYYEVFEHEKLKPKSR